MTLKEAIFGEHGLQVWIAAMLWTMVGIAIVKTYYYNRANKFNLRFWLNDNLKDVLLGFLSCLVGLRLADQLIHLLAENGISLPIDTDDFVIVMLVVSIYIQNRLHKNRNPISKNVENEMHVHNSECKHGIE